MKNQRLFTLLFISRSFDLFAELTGKHQMRERFLATYEWLHNQVVIPPSQAPDAAPTAQPAQAHASAPPARPPPANTPNPGRDSRFSQQSTGHISRAHWPASSAASAATGLLSTASGALFGPVATRVQIAPQRPALTNDNQSMASVSSAAAGRTGSAGRVDRAPALPPIGQFCTSPPPTPSRRF